MNISITAKKIKQSNDPLRMIALTFKDKDVIKITWDEIQTRQESDQTFQITGKDVRFNDKSANGRLNEIKDKILTVFANGYEIQNIKFCNKIDGIKNVYEI